MSLEALSISLWKYLATDISKESIKAAYEVWRHRSATHSTLVTYPWKKTEEIGSDYLGRTL